MSIKLLTAKKDDTSFIKELFFQVKSQEFIRFHWDKTLLESLLEIQYNAQQKSYEQQFPDAETFIVFFEKNRVGKLTLDKSTNYHVVDISIHNDYQNKGIGTQVLNKIIIEAKTYNKAVTLSVTKDNPAHKLYKKLGFIAVKEDDIYLKMSTQ